MPPFSGMLQTHRFHSKPNHSAIFGFTANFCGASFVRGDQTNFDPRKLKLLDLKSPISQLVQQAVFACQMKRSD
jgi:hypothetical protein